MTCAMRTTNWPGSSARWAADVPSCERPPRPACLPRHWCRPCGPARRSSGLIRNAASCSPQSRQSREGPRAQIFQSGTAGPCNEPIRAGGSADRRAFSWAGPVAQRHTVDRHHREAELRSGTRLDWPAGGPWGRWSGSCRDSVPRRHRHVMLEVACGMRSDERVSCSPLAG